MTKNLMSTLALATLLGSPVAAQTLTVHLFDGTQRSINAASLSYVGFSGLDSEESTHFSRPLKDLPYPSSGLGRKVSDGWWTVFVGPDANSKVTDAGIERMLERLNSDFSFLRDSLGWCPTRPRCRDGRVPTLCR